ncbi:MAG: tRNA guanosine(34) transglycosylase Tgt [bacterium]
MFKLASEKNNIRHKIIKTAHGEIQTPFFMPDATRGYVKGLSSADLESVGVGPMVVNTFHLYLQPGIKKFKVKMPALSDSRMGQKLKVGEWNLHSFMNWPHPLLSDSGGFQVFSLIHKNSKMGQIFDDKVVFKSPLDGSLHELTPEKSIQIQFDLGVDMMVCLDDCPPNDYASVELENSVNRTIDWAKICRCEYDKQIKKRKLKDSARPLLFSVIQGGAEKNLRKYCADELIKIGFDGYGFGAMPVDEDGHFLEDVIKYTAELIPDNALRFALGIGNPEDILKCVSYGWDMFDCVIPTREGRHGKLFLWKSKFQILNPFGKLRTSFKFQKKSKFQNQNSKKRSEFYNTININNSKFSKDFSPINKNSRLPELQQYTKAYLHHLFKMKEPLGARLATLNNLEFYRELMAYFK